MTNEIQYIDISVNDSIELFKKSETYGTLMINISKALEESSQVVVLTSNDVGAAANYISNFKRISKQAETLRKQVVQPLIDKKNELDSFFKSIPQRFELELARLEKEVIDFKKKIEVEAKQKADEERKKLEEEAIQKAIDLEEKRKTEAKEKGISVQEIIPVEPAIIPEIIPQTRKISELNTSKVHTRRTKKVLIIDFVKFVRSLNDEQIVLYLEPNTKALNAERSKYDYEAKSTFEGIEFTYEESVV